MKGRVKNSFWSVKNSDEVFRATSLSTYDFSTVPLYTTLPHSLIQEKVKDQLSGLFKGNISRSSPVTTETHYLLLNTKTDINFGRVNIYVKP